MPTPLIDEALYDRLLDARGALDDGTARLAPVFVPVGPDPDDAAPLRLLFVGQTAYQWDGGQEAAEDGPPLPLTDAARGSADALRRLLINDEHPFWQAVRRVSCQVLEAIGAAEPTRRERLHEVAGWSNVAQILRIQTGADNPPPASATKQRGVCAACLREEVRRMRPTAVVLMIGGRFGAEAVRDAFGPDEAWWQNDPDWTRVAGLRGGWRGSEVLWTNHPGWMRRQGNGVEREDLGFVAGYVTAAARTRTPAAPP